MIIGIDKVKMILNRYSFIWKHRMMMMRIVYVNPQFRKLPRVFA